MMGSCIYCGAQLEPGKKFCVQCGKPVAASGDDMPVPAGAEAVRTATIDLLRDIESAARSYELPQPPDVLATYRERLTANSYQVLVVGEAKRGKSSFINALIGRSLLPTDVDIATSQVFRVHHAEREAYRLRFESGAAREIAATDLPRYGSQVLADAGQASRPDQIIRWIEVDIPTKLLPPSVSLLDTPGLGSLYAGHTQVTQRFVPLADAVIYVLDSSQPMVQPDIEFIEQLLGVTNSIFFIQTRIDQFRRVDWQAIRQRNQAILLEKFGSRLTDTRVWPVSSANMLKAAETGDEDFLAASRHAEMADALQQFLFRAAGWNRVSEAVMLAQPYTQRSRAMLASRLESLIGATQQQREAQESQARQRLAAFEAEWGEQSRQRRQLLDEVRQIVMVGRQSFEASLAPGGKIDKDQRAMIARLTSIEEAQQFSERLGDETMTLIVASWRDVCRTTHRQVAELLTPFLNAADSLHMPTIQSVNLNIASGPQIQMDHIDRLKRTGAGWSGWGAATLSVMGALSLLAGPLALVPIGVAVYGAHRGWKSSNQEQLEKAKTQFGDYLNQILQDARHYFFDPDLEQRHPAVADAFFHGLERNVAEQLETLAQRKSAEARDEIVRLQQQARLDDQRRDAEAARLRGQLSAWDALGGRMQRIATGLEALTAL